MSKQREIGTSARSARGGRSILSSVPDLRDAHDGDSSVLVSLIGVLGYPNDARAIDEEIAMAQDDDRYGIIVAVEREAVLGFASYVRWRAFAEHIWVCRLTAIATATTAQRRGVGRRLMVEVERRAREAGCAFVELRSGRRTSRAAAHGFYEALGYADSCLDHALFRKNL